MAVWKLLSDCQRAILGYILIYNSLHVDSMTIEKEILDGAEDPQLFDFYHVMPEGDVKIMSELDILLTLDQYKRLHASGRSARKSVRDVSLLWTDCIVYYEITSSLSMPSDRKVILDAIAEWEKYTCLVFRSNSTNPSRIQFKDGRGCYSQLGMQLTPQPISLARGCRSKWVVAHEIGHAIGWYHEHMRQDRDRYIRINWDVIPMRFQENYKLYSIDEMDIYNISYDYESVMHYGATVLPGSITTLDPDYQGKIGQRTGFTFKDIKLANLMYKCDAMNCVQKPCPNNGFQFSKALGNNRCECYCDSGNISDPIVLCSVIRDQLTRKKPVSITPKAPPLPQCMDVRKDCKELKTAGKCISQMDLMVDVCSRTCDFCDKGGDLCMDHEKGCRIMAAAGMCEDNGLVDVMKTLCPASCGHCTAAADPCAIQRELIGPVNGGTAILTILHIYFISNVFIMHLMFL